MFESKKISDNELIKMINQGDNAMNQAIEHILDTHATKIEGYIMKQNSSPEEAEDALYEGIAAFIVNVQRGSFNGESTIGTYLTSICKGIWFKKFQRMLVHKKWEAAELEKPQNQYEETVITKELKGGLDFLMTNLKDKCKEVLQLWSMSFSMTEIAEKLDYTSSQVVMNKKNLCLKELRKQLADNPNLANLLV
ncbi:MAG: RNA polymerase sigma factor (sigma-70 family) [Lentimonas sp.]|jgi:RNA polymerase sigma factor (sigma-70 family)